MKKKVIFIVICLMLVSLLFSFFYYQNYKFTASVIETKENCTDSDNGIEYFIKGGIIRCEGNTCTPEVTDVCLENSITLTEFYCNGSRVSSERYNCPEGCENGVCKKNQTQENEELKQTCSDSDNIDYSIKGSVTGNDGEKNYYYEDYCSNNKIIEYYCKNDKRDETEYICPYKCENGACISKISFFQKIIRFFTRQ